MCPPRSTSAKSGLSSEHGGVRAVAEGRSPDGEDFGMSRLVDLVDRPHLTAGALRDDVLSAIASFTQGQFDDDVTLLAVVRRQGPHGDAFQTQKIRLPNMG